MHGSDGLKLSRRQALRLSGLAAAGLSLSKWLPASAQPDAEGAQAPVTSEGPITSPDVALQLLIEGNQRWAAGQATYPNQSVARRAEMAGGQNPFAIVFSCVDSRVPPELVFDRGLGDLLVIRTAAHVIDNAALGSIEFGAEELHIPLIVVLGHEKCGAVTATIEAVDHHADAPGQIAALVNGIRPAVETTAAQAGDRLDNAVRANTVNTVSALRSSAPILTDLLSQGKVRIVGARYGLATGLVEFIA